MFGLSRPDVLSVGDNGVRVGVQKAFALAELPKEKELRQIAEPWAPYRSVASWYLWRSLELPKSSSQTSPTNSLTFSPTNSRPFHSRRSE